MSTFISIFVNKINSCHKTSTMRSIILLFIVRMCEELKVLKFGGYSYGLISFRNDSRYVWHQSCDYFDSDSVPLRLVIPPVEPHPGFIFGLTLYLAEYLSLSLNTSTQFMKSVGFEVPSSKSEFDFSTDGDVIASNYEYFFSNPRNRVIRSMASPIFAKVTGSILSLKKPINLTVSSFLYMFDTFVSKKMKKIFFCINYFCLENLYKLFTSTCRFIVFWPPV